METINSNQFTDLVLNSNKLVLVDFYADWCGPCKMLSPLLEELSKEIDPEKVVFYKVDTDNSPDLAMKYNIRSIPNVILFKDGLQVANKIGLADKETYRSLIAEKLLK